MTSDTDGRVHVRYWASVKAAAGTAEEEVDLPAGATLADLLTALRARYAGTSLPDRLAACAVLVGSAPVGTRDPALVPLPVGANVEFLPPFAGG